MPDFDDPTCRDEFAHRRQRPIKDIPVFQQEVEKLVEELLYLEAKTHPANQDPSDKELCSLAALGRMERLVDILSGWAIDHRAGMILDGAPVYPWPEEDQEAPMKANDHRHEAMGSAYLRTNESGDPQENRRIIAEIAARVALLPPSLRYEFSEAIRAVDFGETRPLFQPPKGQHKHAYTKWQLRLRAIEHTYFLWGSGNTKEDAFQMVAKAFGVGSYRVDSWDRGPSGLLHRFGEAAVKVARKTAKRSGKQVQHLQMKLHKTEMDELAIKMELMRYGLEALSLNGQRFKEAGRDDSE